MGTRWEYLVIQIATFDPSSIERRLNADGTEGWELVTIRHVRNDADLYILKRPIPRRADTKKG